MEQDPIHILISKHIRRLSMFDKRRALKKVVMTRHGQNQISTSDGIVNYGTAQDMGPFLEPMIPYPPQWDDGINYLDGFIAWYKNTYYLTYGDYPQDIYVNLVELEAYKGNIVQAQEILDRVTSFDRVTYQDSDGYKDIVSITTKWDNATVIDNTSIDKLILRKKSRLMLRILSIIYVAPYYRVVVDGDYYSDLKQVDTIRIVESTNNNGKWTVALVVRGPNGTTELRIEDLVSTVVDGFVVGGINTTQVIEIPSKSLMARCKWDASKDNPNNTWCNNPSLVVGYQPGAAYSPPLMKADIVGIDVPGKKFYINGEYNQYYIPGTEMFVRGVPVAGTNYGKYTILGAAYIAGTTRISVEEVIPSSTVAGYITINPIFKKDIITVHQGSRYFEVDFMGWFAEVYNIGLIITVKDSTGNDGHYTARMFSDQGIKVRIYVNESIPDATVDGQVVINPVARYSGPPPSMVYRSPCRFGDNVNSPMRCWLPDSGTVWDIDNQQWLPDSDAGTVFYEPDPDDVAVNVTSNSYVDRQVVNSNVYIYELYAINSFGSEQRLNERLVITAGRDNMPPMAYQEIDGPFGNIVTLRASFDEQRRVRLNWNLPDADRIADGVFVNRDIKYAVIYKIKKENYNALSASQQLVWNAPDILGPYTSKHEEIIALPGVNFIKLPATDQEHLDTDIGDMREFKQTFSMYEVVAPNKVYLFGDQRHFFNLGQEIEIVDNGDNDGTYYIGEINLIFTRTELVLFIPDLLVPIALVPQGGPPPAPPPSGVLQFTLTTWLFNYYYKLAFEDGSTNSGVYTLIDDTKWYSSFCESYIIGTVSDNAFNGMNFLDNGEFIGGTTMDPLAVPGRVGYLIRDVVHIDKIFGWRADPQPAPFGTEIRWLSPTCTEDDILTLPSDEFNYIWAKSGGQVMFVLSDPGHELFITNTVSDIFLKEKGHNYYFKGYARRKDDPTSPTIDNLRVLLWVYNSESMKTNNPLFVLHEFTHVVLDGEMLDWVEFGSFLDPTEPFYGQPVDPLKLWDDHMMHLLYLGDPTYNLFYRNKPDKIKFRVGLVRASGIAVATTCVSNLSLFIDPFDTPLKSGSTYVAKQNASLVEKLNIKDELPDGMWHDDFGISVRDPHDELSIIVRTGDLTGLPGPPGEGKIPPNPPGLYSDIIPEDPLNNPAKNIYYPRPGIWIGTLNTGVGPSYVHLLHYV